MNSRMNFKFRVMYRAEAAPRSTSTDSLNQLYREPHIDKSPRLYPRPNSSPPALHRTHGISQNQSAGYMNSPTRKAEAPCTTNTKHRRMRSVHHLGTAKPKPKQKAKATKAKDSSHHRAIDDRPLPHEALTRR